MHTKRITQGYGKKPKWIVTPNPGPHPQDESLPLLLVVRNILGYANDAREAKFIIKKGEIWVDKKVKKDPKYGVGLMDVIELPKVKRYFRVLPSKKGMTLKEVEKKEAQFKLCQVRDKRILGKGEIQLNLHDGSNILVTREEGDKIKTKGTLVLELPARKIQKKIEFKKGNTVMIVKGRHSGEIGKIKEIFPRTQTQRSLTKVGDSQTLSAYIFVIGEDKALISS